MQLLLNNFILNFLIRSFGLEKAIYHRSNPYLHFKVDPKKSTQENAGYSDRPEINEVVERTKQDLRNTVSELCKQDAQILDIGCGPGQYLSLFKETKIRLQGTDISLEMISECRKNIPEAQYTAGDFMQLNFKNKFDLIYCIGVLVYIPRTEIKTFFKKVHSLLEPGGIFYLNYPHALSLLDTLFNDLSYIQYSPSFIEKCSAPYFEILKHEHAVDGRKITDYDRRPYKSLNPSTDRTYRNSSLLVIRKRS
jgi:cyclopropane fatty-acyl-phospholipid synthase-like methyltransferase